MNAARFALCLLSLVAISAPTSAQRKPDKQERAAMALSAEDVSRLVEVKGQTDDLEPAIWISTQPFLRGRSGTDKFLRANLDKTTGNVFYQLYLSAVFPQSMRFDRMTYVVAGKLRSAKVDRIYFDVSCQRYGCSYYEDYVVNIPREELEALAADDAGPYWRARLFGQNVQGVDVEVLRNETAGLIIAVDRSIQSLTPSPKPN